METTLRVIDSHLHFDKNQGFDQIAVVAGYENTEASLHQAFRDNHIVHGVVMSNKTLNPEALHYPEYLSYCIGLDRPEFNEERNMGWVAEMVEANLQRPNCCGIKLYPGYNQVYVYDDRYAPIYELARKYRKPVAFHTGLMAGSSGLLKYSHPLTLDDVAVQYPDVQLVMCHFGNPLLPDAIAVMEKNPNIAVDLSGLLEGRLDDRFYQEKQGYIAMLRDWLLYLGPYNRVLFGTDWPLANYTDYIAFVKKIIPERYWQAVFFDNANRIYKLGL